jgi:hypothetical protein
MFGKGVLGARWLALRARLEAPPLLGEPLDGRFLWRGMPHKSQGFVATKMGAYKGATLGIEKRGMAVPQKSQRWALQWGGELGFPATALDA